MTAAWSDGEICINAWNIPWIICNRSSLEDGSPHKKFKMSCSSTRKLTRAHCVGLDRACQHCHGCFLSLQFRNYCFQLLLSQIHGLTDESRVKTWTETGQKNHHKLCEAKDWSFLPHWLLMERNTWLQQIRYWAREIFDFDLSSWLLLRLVLISNFPCELMLNWTILAKFNVTSYNKCETFGSGCVIMQ